jgi:hypothetical protein
MRSKSGAHRLLEQLAGNGNFRSENMLNHPELVDLQMHQLSVHAASADLATNGTAF